MIHGKVTKILFCFSIAVTLFLSACGGEKEETNIRVEKTISVKGALVATASKNLLRSYTGTLEGEKQAVISARIAEAVDEIMFVEGASVSTGQVLIRLDRTGPSSSYFQTKSIFRNAEKNYKKTKYLYDQGAVSEMQYDGARTEYEVSRANFEASRRLIDIRTPIDGLVTSIDVSPGDYLHPGQKVGTIASIDKLRLNIGVGVDDIDYFDVGDPVTVMVESSENITGAGRIKTVAKSADPVTRSFQVEVEIDNNDHALKPGMFARAEIIIEKFENIIIIPRDAVVVRDNKNYAFVVAGERVMQREVQTAVEFSGSVQILAGLNVGDTLITVGQNYIDDGSKIKLTHLTMTDGKEVEL